MRSAGSVEAGAGAEETGDALGVRRDDLIGGIADRDFATQLLSAAGRHGAVEVLIGPLDRVAATSPEGVVVALHRLKLALMALELAARRGE